MVKRPQALTQSGPKCSTATLGRTGHNSSRLIFGCGATLSRSRHDDLLERAFDAGVNTFDVGYKHYYSDAERNFAPFLKKHRDDIFLISKAQALRALTGTKPLTKPRQKKQPKAGWRF